MLRVRFAVAVLAAGICSIGAAQAPGAVESSAAVAHDALPSLRDTVPQPDGYKRWHERDEHLIPLPYFPPGQTDGALQMTDPLSSVRAQGGVDADGHYELGFLLEALDNVQYAFLQGRFASSAGTPTSMSAVQESTTHQSVYDCDFRSQFVAVYQGPPP